LPFLVPDEGDSLGFISGNIASIIYDAKEKDRSAGIFDLDQKMKLLPSSDPAQCLLGDSQKRGYMSQFGSLKDMGIFLHQCIVPVFGTLKFHADHVFRQFLGQFIDGMERELGHLVIFVEYGFQFRVFERIDHGILEQFAINKRGFMMVKTIYGSQEIIIGKKPLGNFLSAFGNVENPCQSLFDVIHMLANFTLPVEKMPFREFIPPEDGTNLHLCLIRQVRNIFDIGWQMHSHFILRNWYNLFPISCEGAFLVVAINQTQHTASQKVHCANFAWINLISHVL
jgi:hypothetical protein